MRWTQLHEWTIAWGQVNLIQFCTDLWRVTQETGTVYSEQLRVTPAGSSWEAGMITFRTLHPEYPRPRPDTDNVIEVYLPKGEKVLLALEWPMLANITQ